jgi:RNA polymerase sigma-70 factor (ECF subfamily)
VNSIDYLLGQITHYENRGLSLSVWFSLLAHNQAISVRRQTGRNTSLENIYRKRDDNTTAILARHQWECERVQQVLVTLPNHYRQRLWLCFGYALSLEATA